MPIQSLKAIFPRVRSLPPHQLRRDVNKVLHWKDDRMHNHSQERGELYRYPPVQFRELDGMAYLFGVGNGVPALLQLFGEQTLPSAYQQEAHIHLSQTEIELTQTPIAYTVGRFLAFNTDNFSNWKETTPLTQRVQLIENVLTGNLLDFCSFAGYRVPDKKLVVTINDFSEHRSVKLSTGKGALWFLCFDVLYNANIVLPDEIGLGKGKSKGFGINRLM